MPELHCPACDYNLTGLRENRCPECGRPFDPAELQRSPPLRRPPIGLRAALLQQLWIPLIFWILAPMGPFALLAVLVQCALGIPLAHELAGRLVDGRALRQGLTVSPQRDRRPILKWTLGFALWQMILSFGGGILWYGCFRWK